MVINKRKLFLENFFVYGLGGVISKIVPIIVLPLITRLMPSSAYFGINDLAVSLIQFGSSIGIMGMYDAAFRLFFEKDSENYKKTVCSTALFFTIISSIVVCIIIIIFKNTVSIILFKSLHIEIIYISVVSIFVTATNSILCAPTRMQNKRFIFLIINSISSIVSYTIGIIILLKGEYVIALPLAALITGVSIELAFIILNHRWFDITLFDKKILVQLLSLAIPIMPNFLVYWVFSSCDKIMISNILNIEQEGVYAIASKAGAISQLIYLAFSGGWQYFSFATMKENNQVERNSKIFEYLASISFLTTIVICAWSYTTFNIFFPTSYINGFVISPYLFLSPLLLMLFQVLNSQFLIIKKSWPNLLILLAGVVTNIILNYCLIPLIGIEGAAIATLSGYSVSVIISIFVLLKLKLFILSKRMIISLSVFILAFFLWRFLCLKNIFLENILLLIVLLSYIILYKCDICLVLKKKNNIN